jgi:hypothetical protein
VMWLEDAACVGEPMLPWDADGPSAGRRVHPGLLAALAVCRSCRVRVECLADADGTEVGLGDIHGVRGGLTVPERMDRRLRRRR